MKNYLLTLLMFCFFAKGFAQEITVKGKVVDPNGTPLPGVSIVEKGTTNGLITNIDGVYSINVSGESMLVFSFIGYETVEEEVFGRTTIDVTLTEQTFELNEAVVTALGISKAKKTVGYATQEVGMEELVKAKSANLSNMLTGRVAGLHVSNLTGMFQGAEYTLRGKNPLIVVDNIPITSEMWEISPDDIAQINVLKGTSASALYGSRGADGAILITTKNAEKEGLEVEVSTNTMITAGYCAFPEVQEEYGNGSNGLYEFWDGADGGISDGDMVWGPKFSTTDKIAQWNSPIRNIATGKTIEWYGDVSGTQYDDQSLYERVPIDWEYHNVLDAFLRPGMITKNNVSVSYKGDKASHRFSTNYSYQQGQVPNSSLQTGGVKLNSTFKLTPTLTLDTRFGYDKIYSPNYPRYGYGPKNHIYTILVWMGWDVEPTDLENNLWMPGQEGYRQANWNYAWYNNPYFAAYELNQEYNEDILKGNINLTWDITKSLSVTGRASAVKTARFEDRESPKSYMNYSDSREGDYKTWNRDWLTVDNDIHATYRNQITSGLNLTVNTGAAAFIHKYEHYYAATDGLVVPGVYSLSNSQNDVTASMYYQSKTIRSVYATADFDVIDAFFFNLSYRNDWSSALPEDNQSYNYPSASLSIMLSNLVDMPETIDYLKLFGSWASVRNDFAQKISSNSSKVESEYSTANYAGFENPYQLASYYNNLGTYDGNTMLSYPSNIINTDIKPELTNSYELGLSSALLKNRIGFGLTYYNIVQSDNILSLSLSNSTGYSSRQVNGNEYTTNGIEFELSAKPVMRQDFGWSFSANVSHYVKKLTEIYGGEEKYGNYSLNERVDNLYATGWLKSADGRVILNEETGMPTKDSYVQLFGHTNPDAWYGMQNTFRFGEKLTMNLDLDGTIGGVMASKTVAKMWWGGKTKESTTYRDEQYATSEAVYLPSGVNVVGGELVRDSDGNITSDTRVYQENTTKVNWQTWCQNYPYRAYVGEDESETFANVLSRSFLKVRRIAITYDLSDYAKRAVGLKGLETTLFCNNAFMIKKAKVIDPDFGRDDELQDPSARYIGVNLKLKF